MMITPFLEQVLCLNSFRQLGKKWKKKVFCFFPLFLKITSLKSSISQRGIFWGGKLCSSTRVRVFCSLWHCIKILVYVYKLILWDRLCSFYEIVRGMCFPQNVKNCNDIHLAVYYIWKLLMRKFSKKTLAQTKYFCFWNLYYTKMLILLMLTQQMAFLFVSK